MADMLLEAQTSKASMDEVRSTLDAALKEQFPGGLMRSKWQGDVLELSGPGAQGTITFEAGRLVGRAKLSPPASLMRAAVEDKISKVLTKAASG